MVEKNIVNEAKRYWKHGHNCAQSAAGGILDYFGFESESEILNKSFLPYGGGIGERSICGSLVGALGALSFLLKEKGLDNEKIYAKIKVLKTAFAESNGSLYCKELLDGYIDQDGKIDIENPERKKVCDQTVETVVLIVKDIVENIN
ncbi:MAG: C_GCAxxG_C_C family protein [Asgard group archaeon]|nr:C_GCAxxG_C_C family protein [Asgard group archaeon]